MRPHDTESGEGSEHGLRGEGIGDDGEDGVEDDDEELR